MLFGMMVMRELTDEQHAQLQALLGSFTPSAPVSVPFPLPEAPPAPPVVIGLNGEVQYGNVTIRWANGVPVRAQDDTNRDRWAWVPEAWWRAVRENAPEGLWVPFTYLAFLESDYVPTAKNLSSLENSWGALQVNRNAWPQYSQSELSTYAGNVRAAVNIYNLQGFGAWFNSGRRLGLV